MSQIMTRIGAGGRVVLPAAVRKAMGVVPGDELILISDEEGVHLVTPAQAALRAQRMVSKWVAPRRRLSRELIAERRREAAGE